tara:strand:+ start:1913 stop:2755 length:843 start_codon:yes stop_codon:yes gene_type:complete
MCSIFPGNARDYDNLTYEKLGSLVSSIIETKGNTYAVLARRTGDADKPYEIIAGSRRHWSVAYARKNGHPDIELLAVVDDVDDATAFRLADIENREREDVSDIERARSYAVALKTYYDGNQAKMSKHLTIHKATLSRLLSLAALPEEILATFADVASISAYLLRPVFTKMDGGVREKRMMAKAQELQDIQTLRMADEEPLLDDKEIVKALLSAAESETTRSRGRRPRPELATADGVAVAEILKDTRREGLTIRLLPSEEAEDAILDAVRRALSQAKFRQS